MKRALLGVLFGLASCKGITGPGHAKVGETLLAQADSSTVLPLASPAVVVVARPGDTPKAVPASGPVELALSWDLPWSQVNAILIELEGRDVHLLVGQNEKLARFTLEDSFDVTRVLHLNDNGVGKACLTAPGVKEGKCVQSYDKKYIDRAGVREITREGVKSLGIEQVEVEVFPDTIWGDVVRLVDGARTCCAGTAVKVKLSEASHRP